jgi:tetratricopeptide (TPR) repeat protein
LTQNWLLDVLGELADNSLLQLAEIDGAPRFSMLETVRGFAAGRLAASGEGETVRRRHLSWYGELVEQAERGLQGSDQAFWNRRLSTEQDNVRAALAWALRDKGIGASAPDRQQAAWIAGCMWYFWYVHGLLDEARAWLTLAIEKVRSGTRGRAKALTGAGCVLWQQGEYARAEPLFEESIASWRESGDRSGLAEAVHLYGHLIFDRQQYSRAGELFRDSLALYDRKGDESYRATLIGDLGMIACHQGDYVGAQTWYEQGLALFRELGVEEGAAATLLRLGDLDRLAGDYDRAATRYQEALVRCRDLGEDLEVASALHKTGQVLLHAGETAQAVRLFGQSLELQYRHGNQQGIVECLAALAGAAAAAQAWERAAILFGAATALLDRLGAPLAPADLAVWQEQEAVLRQQMEPQACAAAWAKGQALTVEQAVVLAVTDQFEETG